MKEYPREKLLRDLSKRATGSDTICDIHRKLFSFIGDIPENRRKEAQELMVIAHRMALKMTDRLRFYKELDRDTMGSSDGS